VEARLARFVGSFFPHGKQNLVRLWNVATGKQVAAVDAKTHCYAAAISPDNRLLATGGGDQIVRLWDANKLRVLREFQGHKAHVYTVRFSPSGKLLVSGDAAGEIRLWDLDSGKTVRSYQQPGKVVFLALSLDGRRAASGDDEGITIWGLPRLGGEMVSRPRSLAFSLKHVLGLARQARRFSAGRQLLD
jgi:WD40 repeat protein